MSRVESQESRVKSREFRIKTFKSSLNLLPYTLLLLPFVFCLVFSSVIIAQQDEELPIGVVPVPKKELSKDETKLLQAEDNNVKKRTKISLQLMETRLVNAEKLHVENNYQAAINELAGFQAILDNMLDFLLRTDANDRRFIDFEIYLRKQIPRLETVRREMPFKYSYHVGKLMKAVREARAKAVEPIFENTVVPNAVKKPE